MGQPLNNDGILKENWSKESGFGENDNMSEFDEWKLVHGKTEKTEGEEPERVRVI